MLTLYDGHEGFFSYASHIQMLTHCFQHSTFVLKKCSFVLQIAFHIKVVSFSKMRYRNFTWKCIYATDMREHSLDVKEQSYYDFCTSNQKKIHMCTLFYVLYAFYDFTDSNAMYNIEQSVTLKLRLLIVVSTIEENKCIFIPSVYTHSIAFSNFFSFYHPLSTRDLYFYFTRISVFEKSQDKQY